MSTRAAIRPRPLDINKQLLIVKDVSELDSNDAQGQAAGDSGSQAPEAAHGHSGHGHGSSSSSAAHKKPKAIPIPDIREVETHYRDYLPLFSHPITYLHGKGCGGNREPEPVEYDLDNEDEDWLRGYNLGRSKLSDVTFERMLWRLEVECAAATDGALTAAGAGPSERTAASAVAAIDHLGRQDAVRKLALDCGGREKLLWDVYNYWAAKRKKWGKPILRRLQAPTLPSDTNPYNTFRPREKVNRPQTRRRRDNSDELLDKLRQMRDNLVASKAILEEVVRRERRKRDLACTELELLTIQYRSRHEDKSHDQISSEALNRLRDRMRVNGQADQIRAGMRLLANKNSLPPGVPLSRKRRREEVLRCLRPMAAAIIAAPPAVEPEALWAMPANLLQIPLESKEAYRQRMDDKRRGKPVAPPGAVRPSPQAAANTSKPGPGAAAASAAAAPGAAAAGAAAPAPGATAAGAAAPAAAAPGAAAPAGAPAAAASAAAAGAPGAAAPAAAAGAAGAAAAAHAGQAPVPATSGLPPPGPSGGGPLMGRMNAVVAALNERQHLYRLPDGLAGNITSWRCFIGRGGRARLERIDHVTHESLNALKQEQIAIQQHYAAEPWPPMPTAPLLKDIVDRCRPPLRPGAGMSRSGSLGLASQGSSASTMAAAAAAAGAGGGAGPGQRRPSSGNIPQQAAAAGRTGAGGIPATASLQQPVQMQQGPQAQQAHTAGQPPPQQQQQQQGPQPMQVDPSPAAQQQPVAAAAAAAAPQQALAGTGSAYPGGVPPVAAAPAATPAVAAAVPAAALQAAPGGMAYQAMQGVPAAQQQQQQAAPEAQSHVAAAGTQPQPDPAAAAGGAVNAFTEGAPAAAAVGVVPGQAAAAGVMARSPATKTAAVAQQGAAAAAGGAAAAVTAAAAVGLPPAAPAAAAKKGPGRPPKSKPNGTDG